MPCVSTRKMSQNPNQVCHVINSLLTELDQGGSILASVFFASLWTSSSFRSINTQERIWPISSHLDLTLGR